MRFLTSILALAATAAALTITSPKSMDQVDMSKPVDIEWTAVDSDPKNFTIILVNVQSNPPVSKVLAKDVKSSDEKYTVDGASGIPKSIGYQINFVSTGPMNTGILAQSPQFNVTDVKSASTTTTSTKSKGTATATETTTATASATETNAGAALAIPAAGSFMMGLFALVL
ncbi:GPI anchored serine-threonine rich family protein [Aspergillus clavatus NRRL 1]|uniref:Yeast cell wall synthesis Kre9/Knh1-like N-terminal domain-containing protein n=1 Tax=Aspergillus clavatus (strain ATCC 1007 / CBS 513.65 / DSM 816 / NCTC 3887 / NRRL 1 / QM 1276 / 107) TaxID=344612 RepID=A1CTE5_ASPCL|nr:uncharacterized protein ACLA_082730 [Aspergillus clavatus NRRL 1]EAW06582.1 conserved hypothetical protein [Aspergillus clavatus NRRL 1]